MVILISLPSAVLKEGLLENTTIQFGTFPRLETSRALGHFPLRFLTTQEGS